MSLPQVKDDIYETLTPRTPIVQGDIMVSKGSTKGKLISTQNIFTGKHFQDENLSPSIMNPPVPVKAFDDSQDHIMAEQK
jgi:hypothetical protein